MCTFEHRLYRADAQRQRLMACLIKSLAIYSEMLEALKAQHEAGGTFPSRYDLTAHVKGRGGGECIQKSLSVRTHLCPSCGLVEVRDANAAKNILRARTPPSGT